MTKWMTHSFRLQQNKRDDRVKPKMLNLDIYLILHWTSSWFYLMSMMKRLTNSTNLLSLSSRSLFLEWLMFFMEWTIDTPCALQCFMRLLPKPVERKAKITILKKFMLFFSDKCLKVSSFQLAFSGLTQHLSCLIVWTLLITTFLLVSSPPLSLWAQRGAKIKPHQVGLPARMRRMSCTLATPPGILIPVQQSVHAFVLHPTF